MNKVAFKTALAATAAGALYAAPASASTIDYDVTNYGPSGPCTHGLYTNRSDRGCAKRYEFQDGTTFSQDLDAGTATFTGTAINLNGKTATLDLTLGGFKDALNGEDYKAGGLPYNPSTMDFYTTASGTITIDGKVFTLANDPFAGDTTFQFGVGANDKNSAFGGSAWLNLLDPSGWSIPHWDINFNLSERPGTPVPAPGGMALFGLALAGLWLRQRRRPAA